MSRKFGGGWSSSMSSTSSSVASRCWRRRSNWWSISWDFRSWSLSSSTLFGFCCVYPLTRALNCTIASNRIAVTQFTCDFILLGSQATCLSPEIILRWINMRRQFSAYFPLFFFFPVNLSCVCRIRMAEVRINWLCCSNGRKSIWK